MRVRPEAVSGTGRLLAGAERGRAFGLLGATIGVSTAVGPLLGGLLAGVAVLTGFWFWERGYGREHAAVVDLNLFGRHSYTYGICIAVAYFAAFTPVFFVFRLLLQNGLGYSALGAGIAVAPFAVGSAASAAIGGRFVTRIGRPLVLIGLAAVGLGLADSAGSCRRGNASLRSQ